MIKKMTVPAAKPATKAAPAAATKPTETKAPVPVAATPAVASKPAPAPAVAEPKKIDLNKPAIKDAITKGKELLKESKTKADVAMVIFEALKDEDKDTVIAAFVQGAGLTEKGAVTYWYNCKRKARKTAAKPA
ncbi:MAG: hypothetical protein WBQ69_05725 [Gallionella sp.]